MKDLIENPAVQAIVWSQYTPYFNDGDTCKFGINEVYFVIDGFEEDNLLLPYEYEEEAEIVDTSQMLDWYKLQAEKENKSNKEYYVNRYAELKRQAELYPDLSDNCKKMENIINSNEELMEDIFGDHCSVYITKDRIIVEAYEHD